VLDSKGLQIPSKQFVPINKIILILKICMKIYFKMIGNNTEEEQYKLVDGLKRK